MVVEAQEEEVGLVVVLGVEMGVQEGEDVVMEVGVVEEVGDAVEGEVGVGVVVVRCCVMVTSLRG